MSKRVRPLCSPDPLLIFALALISTVVFAMIIGDTIICLFNELLVNQEIQAAHTAGLLSLSFSNNVSVPV